jgi:RimJ/RimL family protein N-acetyltransferase
MLANVPWPLTQTDVESYVARHRTAADDAVDFAVVVESVPVGVCTLKKPGSGNPPREMPRLGYWIGRPHWGRGYATEAVRALTRFAFDSFPAEIVGAGVFSDNPASRRVLEKLGFSEAGRYEVLSLARGSSVPSIDMQITRAEWDAAGAGGA